MPCGIGMAHKGLNLLKRFTNLRVLDSSRPQNEKRLSYRKQKSYLGSKVNFVFFSCLPHFTFGLTNLVGIRKVRQVYDFTERLESVQKCNLFLMNLNTSISES